MCRVRILNWLYSVVLKNYYLRLWEVPCSRQSSTVVRPSSSFSTFIFSHVIYLVFIKLVALFVFLVADEWPTLSRDTLIYSEVVRLFWASSQYGLHWSSSHVMHFVFFTYSALWPVPVHNKFWINPSLQSGIGNYGSHAAGLCAV
jgi:hypothetical protein